MTRSGRRSRSRSSLGSPPRPHLRAAPSGVATALTNAGMVAAPGFVSEDYGRVRDQATAAPRTRNSSRSSSGFASRQQPSPTLRGQAISGMSPYEERVLRALRRTISGSPGETVVFEAADTELRRLRRLLELSMQETDRAAASADTRLRQLQRRLANANEQNAGLLSELVRLRVAVLACGCGAAFRSMVGY